MEKVKLTRVFTTDKNKDGSPLMGRNGKPYTRLAIKCEEHGDKWLSGFQGSRNASWKEGDTVDIIVEQKGEYLNFRMPKKEDELEIRIKKLEDKVFGNSNPSDDKLPDYPDTSAEGFPFDE